jgi:hypothetical protein
MYNPFPLLTPGLLKDQVARGKRYFVRQSFPRGYEGRLKAAFLLRGYPAEEMEMADSHLAALKQDVALTHPAGLGRDPNASLARDPNAYLYDATLPEHLERLLIAAGQPFGYKVFYAAKKGVDWEPPTVYQEKMKAYIRRHHPTWRTQKDGEKISIGLHEEFGELFLTFSFDKESDKIPFDLIEQY